MSEVLRWIETIFLFVTALYVTVFIAIPFLAIVAHLASYYEAMWAMREHAARRQRREVIR